MKVIVYQDTAASIIASLFSIVYQYSTSAFVFRSFTLYDFTIFRHNEINR